MPENVLSFKKMPICNSFTWLFFGWFASHANTKLPAAKYMA